MGADNIRYDNRSDDRKSDKAGSIRTVVGDDAASIRASMRASKTPAMEYAERASQILHPVSPIFADSCGNPDQEVILRSSDSYDFYVNRFILKIGSPALGQLEPNSKDNTLLLPEPACILDVLLTLLYPVESPTWTSMEGFGPVLDAAIRYDMRGVIEELRQALISPRRVGDDILPSFVEIDPLRVFAVARQAGLEPEAQLAGGATRNISLRNSQMSMEVENMPTKYYRELISLRDDRGAWRDTIKAFKARVALKGSAAAGLARSSTGSILGRNGSQRSIAPSFMIKGRA